MSLIRVVRFICLTVLFSPVVYGYDTDVLTTNTTETSPTPFTTISARIIGGTETIQDYPWMVSLQAIYQTSPSVLSDHFCGGTLIAKDWVLTAAHCLEDETIASFRMYIGTKNAVTNEAGEERRAEWFALHPNYNPKDFSNDIAIIKLSAPSANTPLPLIDLTSNESLIQNDQLTVIGWGLTEDGNLNSASDDLLEVNVSFQADTVCRNTYGQAYNGDLAICAGEDNGVKDSCQGDSGGPLMLKANGEWVLAGMVSWGGDCGVEGSFGVYTEVANYLDWISDRLNGITLLGPNKIGFLGYGRKKSEEYRLVNNSDTQQTIISADLTSNNQYFELHADLSSLSIDSNSEKTIEINAIGSYLGEHDDSLILNAGGEDFGIPLNSKVLYDLESDALGVNWDLYSGTNEITEHAEPWFEVEDNTNGRVLRSGVIHNNNRSVLLMYVKGVSSGDLFLKFDTRVDAEYSDGLLISVNEIDGYTVAVSDWHTKEIALPYDINRVQFIYIKDASISRGEDAAYLSNVRVCTILADESSCDQLDSWNVVDTSATKKEIEIGEIGKGGNAAYLAEKSRSIKKGSGGLLVWQWFMLLVMLILMRSRGERA